MLSDDVRRRLAQLHASPHSPLRATVEGYQPADPPSRDMDFAAEGEVVANVSGEHLRFRRSIERFWPQGAQAIAALGHRRMVPAAGHVELAALRGAFPRQALFLDLETCGFAGSMVFLAGLLWYDGQLIVDQLLARSYAEERALLESLWQIAARNRVLVTFNGKSFDWPMVHDRSTRYHLGRDLRGHRSMARWVRPGEDRPPGGGLRRDDPRPELVHCDLLHHARRRWKRQLPDCRLQTLERYVCRRFRRDDLPGAQVPAAYHEFVRSGQTHSLGAILRHNALDLVTLAQLACRLLDNAVDGPALAAKRA
jgi:uncharacterized protein YprB with RNaseH-like and TPR domain